MCVISVRLHNSDLYRRVEPSRVGRSEGAAAPQADSTTEDAMRTRMIALMVALALTTALAPPTHAPPAHAQASGTDDGAAAEPQMRAYWADAFNIGIYSPDEVDELVDELVDANLNTLFVQVGRRFDCFCNASDYPRTHAGIDPEPYDPLAAVIEAAHEAGIEVHAWINATTLWNQADPPPQPDHAFNLHGPDAEGRDRWLNRQYDGDEIIGVNAFIDPGHPDAVDYQAEAIASVVANYDVDGVNLDYIRYPDFNDDLFVSDWGYNETSLERFRRATGRDDVPPPDDPEWSQWRRDQVTNMVQRIKLAVAEVDPSVTLSVDAVTYAFGPQTYGSWEQTRPYAETLQDWRGWMEDGIIDLLVPMNYKRNWMQDQAQMFSEWTEFIADNQYDRLALNGPALYLNDIDDSIAQARETFEPSAAGNTIAGWSGYSYANATQTATGSPDPEVKRAERAALAEALTVDSPDGQDPIFAEPADTPEMPWKASEAHVAGQITPRSGRHGAETARDGATVELRRDGDVVVTTSADGSGHFGFLDVDPGRYEVRLLGDEFRGGTTRRVNAVEGQVVTTFFPVR